MASFDECIRKAEECRQLADRTRYPHVKDAYRQLAEVWETHAREQRRIQADTEAA